MDDDTRAALADAFDAALAGTPQRWIEHEWPAIRATRIDVLAAELDRRGYTIEHAGELARLRDVNRAQLARLDDCTTDNLLAEARDEIEDLRAETERLRAKVVTAWHCRDDAYAERETVIAQRDAERARAVKAETERANLIKLCTERWELLLAARDRQAELARDLSVERTRADELARKLTERAPWQPKTAELAERMRAADELARQSPVAAKLDAAIRAMLHRAPYCPTHGVRLVPTSASPLDAGSYGGVGDVTADWLITVDWHCPHADHTPRPKDAHNG